MVCHLIEHRLAVPLDVGRLRPGAGEETAAKRLPERVFATYPRFFDVVGGDALSFDAPFINFCLEQHKHALVVVKGDQRLLLPDAQGVFAQQVPPVWQDGRRTVRDWDADGVTTCAGVRRPLRVVSVSGSGTSRRRCGRRSGRCGAWRRSCAAAWEWRCGRRGPSSWREPPDQQRRGGLELTLLT